MDWSVILGNLISAPMLLGILGLLVKAFPQLSVKFATWVATKIDPDQFPYGSNINEHWHQVARVGERIENMQDTIDVQLKEIQKDVVKNTIMNLMDKPGDNSVDIRYELNKLEKLNASCWIMDLAEEYLRDPEGYIAKHHKKSEPTANQHLPINPRQ